MPASRRRTNMMIALALFAALGLCLSLGVGQRLAEAARQRQTPHLDSATIETLMQIAREQDPTAEVTTVDVRCDPATAPACRVGPQPLTRELALDLFTQLGAGDPKAVAVTVTVACRERFDAGWFEPRYACTWDRGAGPEPLTVP